MSISKAAASIGGLSILRRVLEASSLLAIVIILLPLIASAQPRPSSGYKIGLAAPLTGEFGYVGKEMEHVAKEAVKAINDSGGLLGQRVVLEILDDAGSPEKAVAIARQFIDRIRVDAVIGHIPRCAISAAKTYQGANMLFISPLTSSDLLETPYTNIVHLRPPATRLAEAAAEIIALGNQQGMFGRNWGIIQRSGDIHSQKVASSLVPCLQNKKLIVPFNQIVEENSVFQGLISERKPEGLFFTGSSPIFAKKIIGEKPPNLPMILLGMLGNPDSSWEEFNKWKQQTDAVRTIFVFSVAALSNDFQRGKLKSTPWREIFWRANQGSKQPTLPQVFVFTAFDLLAQVVKEKGSRDSNIVRRDLSAKAWSTFMGNLQVGKSGEIQGISFRLHGSHYMSGNWKPSMAVSFDMGPKFEDQPPPTATSKSVHDQRFNSLIKDLQSPDKKVRHNAVRALGKRRDKAAVQPLIEALKDPDREVRFEAAAALGQIRDKAAVQPLIGALKDSDEGVRSKAAEALGKIEDKAAVQPLIRAMEDSAPEVRTRAAEALGWIGDKAAVQPLIRALKDSDKGVRLEAAGALGRQGDTAAIQPLRMAQSDPAPEVRYSAAEAIEKLQKLVIKQGKPKEEPVYNVEVTPRKLEDRLVLLPGKETSVVFYIGPESKESITKDLPSVPMITDYKGDELELTVTLNCSLCEKDTNQQDQIAYRPKDRKSSKARFKIVPSSAIVSKSQGIGDLIFTVDDRGNVLDRIRVRAFVGDPTPEGLAVYMSPAKVPIETSPVEEGRFPDIIIGVGFPEKDGKIPIVIRPRLESLQKVFFDEFGNGRGSGPEMSWIFKSGVTKADVDGLVLDIYKTFRTIMEQNNKHLQDAYKRLGSDVTLEKGAAMLDFSVKDREKMSDMLRKEGENLYWRIFREEAAVNLGKAMDFIENLPSDPPLRVTIQPADIYAPWQILYHTKKKSDKEGKTDPKKFWGFRYVMGITHEKDSRQGRQRNLVQSPKPDEIAFAGWRGSDPKDEVTDRARRLAEHIRSKTGLVEPSYEKKKFIEKLERKAPDIRFIFAYGHATSGTVLDEKKPIISGVEWAPAHFKFSENDLMTPRDFDDLARKVDLKAQPVVILDACETGTFGINAMNNNGFVGALTRAGAGAVIVTESPVLANFAYYFGMNLIDELFDGKADVSQAMLNVRLKHLKEWENPLGLVYTLYGNPVARIRSQ